MEIWLNIAIGVIACAVGVAVTVIMQRRMAATRAKQIIADAEREGADIRRNKELEGREEALRITTEAEKQANQRMQKAQAVETRQKQREIQLNQVQSENARTRNELDATRQTLEAQAAVLEGRAAELEAMATGAETDAALSIARAQTESQHIVAQRLHDELEAYRHITGDNSYLELLEKAYAGGLITVIDYLSEINHFTEARMRYLDLEYRYQQTLARLNKPRSAYFN